MTQEELISELKSRLGRVEDDLAKREAKRAQQRANYRAAKQARADAISGASPAVLVALMLPADVEKLRQAKALVELQGCGEYLTSRVLRVAIECPGETRWTRIAGALQADLTIGYHHGKGWCRNV
jgi:hypothetical protein